MMRNSSRLGQKRNLTDTEIDALVSIPMRMFRRSIKKSDFDTMRQHAEIILEMAENVRIYDGTFEALLAETEMRFVAALIVPKSAIGNIAATANAEPATQNILKSSQSAGAQQMSGVALNELIQASANPTIDWIATRLRSKLPSLSEMLHKQQYNGEIYLPSFADSINLARMAIRVDLQTIVIRQQTGYDFLIIQLDGEDVLAMDCSIEEIIRSGNDPVSILKYVENTVDDSRIEVDLLSIEDEYIRIVLHSGANDDVDLAQLISAFQRIMRASDDTSKIALYKSDIKVEKLDGVYVFESDDKVWFTGDGGYHRRLMEIERVVFVLYAAGFDIHEYITDSFRNIKGLRYSIPHGTNPKDLISQAKKRIPNLCDDHRIIFGGKSEYLYTMIYWSVINPEYTFCANATIMCDLFGITATREFYEYQWSNMISQGGEVPQLHLNMVVDFCCSTGPEIQKITRSYSKTQDTITGASTMGAHQAISAGALKSARPRITTLAPAMITGAPPTSIGHHSISTRLDVKKAKAISKDFNLDTLDDREFATSCYYMKQINLPTNPELFNTREACSNI